MSSSYHYFSYEVFFNRCLVMSSKLSIYNNVSVIWLCI